MSLVIVDEKYKHDAIRKKLTEMGKFACFYTRTYKR